MRTGADGLIRIGGPVVFSGYRNRPDLTGAALDDGWFVTSDVGRLGADGRLTVRGRADEMINTGGEKVAPAEVAAILAGCPGVREAVVFGRARPAVGRTGDRGCGPHRSGGSAEPGAPAYRGPPADAQPRRAPKALILVRELPLLPSGKPDLAAIRALGHELACSDGRAE